MIRLLIKAHWILIPVITLLLLGVLGVLIWDAMPDRIYLDLRSG